MLKLRFGAKKSYLCILIKLKFHGSIKGNLEE